MSPRKLRTEAATQQPASPIDVEPIYRTVEWVAEQTGRSEEIVRRYVRELQQNGTKLIRTIVDPEGDGRRVLIDDRDLVHIFRQPRHGHTRAVVETRRLSDGTPVKIQVYKARTKG